MVYNYKNEENKPTICAECIDYCAEVEENEDNIKGVCFAVDNSYILEIMDLHERHDLCPFYVMFTQSILANLCED